MPHENFRLKLNESIIERLLCAVHLKQRTGRCWPIVLKNSFRKFEFVQSEKIRLRQSLSVGLNVQICTESNCRCRRDPKFGRLFVKTEFFNRIGRTETFATMEGPARSGTFCSWLFSSRYRAAAAHRVRARMARCFTRGSCAAVKVGTTGRVAGVDRRSAPFRQHRATAWMPELRQRRSGCPMPGKRQARCRSLLGTSLLDKQKRSTSPSAGG